MKFGVNFVYASVLYVQYPLVNQLVDHRAGHAVTFELPLCFVEIHTAATTRFGDNLVLDETLHGSRLSPWFGKAIKQLVPNASLPTIAFITAPVAGS